MYFDSILILCNIFVEFEHLIPFNKFDKYYNFIYHRINIKLMVHRQFMSCCKYSILSLSRMQVMHSCLYELIYSLCLRLIVINLFVAILTSWSLTTIPFQELVFQLVMQQ